MKKNILGILVIFISLSFTFPTTTNNEPVEIEWLTIEEAVKRSKKEPRKIFVDVYTDWCGWCKKMDANTYENEVIVNYINDNFYAVKLDAEQKEPIVYKDQTFKFVPNGKRGYHELASSLLSGKLGFPATVFLNKKPN